MKQALLFLLMALLAACKQKPDAPVVQPPQKVFIPDSMHCKAIAPLALSSQKRAVGVRGKYWPVAGVIRVKFIGGTTAQRKYVRDGIAEWSKIANLAFEYTTAASADIRVGFNSGDGSWSYIGTDAKSIPQGELTMNIGWSGLDVCLHELGHAIGLAHEQANPKKGICWNEAAVIKALSGPPNNWDEQTIRSNVFYKYAASDVDATTFDAVSIMQYSIPSSWTCDGNGIPGGTRISASDAAFIATMYPFVQSPPQPNTTKIQITTAQRDSIVKWLTK